MKKTKKTHGQSVRKEVLGGSQQHLLAEKASEDSEDEDNEAVSDIDFWGQEIGGCIGWERRVQFHWRRRDGVKAMT
jgi:hypothetical protein